MKKKNKVSPKMTRKMMNVEKSNKALGRERKKENQNLHLQKEKKRKTAIEDGEKRHKPSSCIFTSLVQAQSNRATKKNLETMPFSFFLV